MTTVGCVVSLSLAFDLMPNSNQILALVSDSEFHSTHQGQSKNIPQFLCFSFPCSVDLWLYLLDYKWQIINQSKLQ